MFGFDAGRLRLEVDTASMDFDVGGLAGRVRLGVDAMQAMALVLQEEFPGGQLSKDEFIDVWARLQPEALRDATAYADEVFEAFDRRKEGQISCMEYMSFLALALQGTVEDKLAAVFKVFDANNDGGLSLLEMTEMISTLALHDVGGGDGMLPPEQLAEMIHEEVDLDGDGMVALDEFLRVGVHEGGVLSGIVGGPLARVNGGGR